MKLSDNLKRIRRDNNLSQEQLAEKLGVSRQAVSKWESAQSYPEMDKVLLICKLFNYNIDELMNENVKEVDETKQSKININKYIDDFFAFVTKTVDVLSSMRFRDRVKCFVEMLFICLFMIVIYLIISAIGGSIFANTFGGILPNNIYIVIRNIVESLCTILYLIITVTVLLHIFKIRYLDYFEIIKENDNEEQGIDTDNQTQEQEKYDEKRKIFIEKKKEKIIIRDPEHSQSKFLTGLFKIILAFIKFMAVCIASMFVFTFIALFCLLILSFMFVKTGLIFFGCLLAIISGIIINFIILECFYNFIISKKSKKTRIAVSFIIALILAGISIGMILIGVTQFTIVEDNSSSFEVEDTYEYEMTENLSLDFYNCAYKYIETDSNKVKIVVKHTKFTRTQIDNMNDLVEIYCYHDEIKTIDLIKTIINDLNNKELKDYSSCAEVEIYASKENIKKMQKNRAENYKINIEKSLDDAYQENQELQITIIELEDEIVDKDNKIEELEMQIQDSKVEMDSNDIIVPE